MQRAMLSAFDDLRNRLITATQPKTSVDLIDSTFAMSSIGGRGLEQLRRPPLPPPCLDRWKPSAVSF